MTVPWAIVTGAAILAVAILLSSFVIRPDYRFQIVTGGPLSSWRLDRETGTVWVCAGGGCKRQTELSN